MLNHQKQTGGDHSVNVQAQNLHVGLTYADARDIASDVFEKNFYKMQGVAKAVVEERIKKFNDELISRLEAKGQAALDSATDPDMQYGMIVAQKEFARSGEKRLGDILVDVLVERAGHKSDLTQIVLTGALETVAKLTESQCDGLTIIWMVRAKVNFPKVYSFEDLRKTVVDNFKPFSGSLPFERSFLLHLDYTGCGSGVSFGGGSNPKEFGDLFPNLFAAGTPEHSIEFQLCKADDCMKEVIRFYRDKGGITRLSSVGIAIAVANLRSKTGMVLETKEYLK